MPLYRFWLMIFEKYVHRFYNYAAIILSYKL